jgi:predicted small metal-binding protein
MMHELDCGCGCHLEGKDEQGLIIKVFLHLEAAHPEIEEPTIELTEEMVAIRAYETSVTSTRISRHLS